MDHPKYDALMSELENIAEKVGRFPEHLQKPVLETVLATYFDQSQSEKDESLPINLENGLQAATADKEANSETRNYVSELVEMYNRYSLGNCNDMEFATFVAYYFTKKAPPEVLVEVVTEKNYVDVCKFTGRPLPKRANAALNNAKNNRRYLERRGSGEYFLSSAGEHYVLHTLLNDNNDRNTLI